MNKRIRELAEQAGIKITPMVVDGVEYEYEDVEMDGSEDLAKFAELIIEECRTVVVEVYHKTPLELCGPLLTADEEIAKYFYGVE